MDIEALLGFLVYSAIGTLTSLVRYRVAGMRGEQPSSDDKIAFFFYGFFWPIGLWVVLVAYVTSPKMIKTQTKDQRERERRLLREREDMRLDAMEADNLIAARQMRQRMELESSQEGS